VSREISHTAICQQPNQQAPTTSTTMNTLSNTFSSLFLHVYQYGISYWPDLHGLCREGEHVTCRYRNSEGVITNIAPVHWILVRMALAHHHVLLLSDSPLVLPWKISSYTADRISAHPCRQALSQGLQGQVVSQPSTDSKELQERTILGRCQAQSSWS
jgi:hypothetical protein